MSPVGIPFVSALNIEKGKILREKLLCLTQEQFSLLRAGKFQRGDILLCIRGSLGKYAIVNDKIGAIASSLVILLKQNPKCYAFEHNKRFLIGRGFTNPHLLCRA